jgi:hypothetical protein
MRLMSGDRSTRRGRGGGGGRGGGRAAAIRGPHSALTDFLAVSLICATLLGGDSIAAQLTPCAGEQHLGARDPRFVPTARARGRTGGGRSSRKWRGTIERSRRGLAGRVIRDGCRAVQEETQARPRRAKQRRRRTPKRRRRKAQTTTMTLTWRTCTRRLHHYRDN